ncbi:zinc finger protein 628-like [Hyalella azteca]|uniref:Zinc finger protein 628-like n=1 Tax=Hyalella azteca TaxID=294128 RepID=A0A8B7N8X9_HYAAZ|nr:zinc finger protein 628-like [Hyalella azteca]
MNVPALESPSVGEQEAVPGRRQEQASHPEQQNLAHHSSAAVQEGNVTPVGENNEQVTPVVPKNTGRDLRAVVVNREVEEKFPIMEEHKHFATIRYQFSGVVFKNSFYHCKLCGFTTKYDKKIRIHFRQEHPKYKVYNCLKCTFNTCFNKSICRHATSQHTGKKNDKRWLMDQMEILEDPQDCDELLAIDDDIEGADSSMQEDVTMNKLGHNNSAFGGADGGVLRQGYNASEAGHSSSGERYGASEARYGASDGAHSSLMEGYGAFRREPGALDGESGAALRRIISQGPSVSPLNSTLSFFNAGVQSEMALRRHGSQPQGKEKPKRLNKRIVMAMLREVRASCRPDAAPGIVGVGMGGTKDRVDGNMDGGTNNMGGEKDATGAKDDGSGKMADAGDKMADAGDKMADASDKMADAGGKMDEVDDKSTVMDASEMLCVVMDEGDSAVHVKKELDDTSSSSPCAGVAAEGREGGESPHGPPNPYTIPGYSNQNEPRNPPDAPQEGCSDAPMVGEAFEHFLGEDEDEDTPDNGDRELKCAFCSFKCDRITRLKSHYGSEHPDKGLHCCPECRYVALHSFNLKRHIISKHSSMKPYKCPECSFSAYTAAKLMEHDKSVHEGRNPPHCTICNYVASSQRDLNMHTKREHAQQVEYECTQCEFSTMQRWRYLRHMRTHRSKVQYQCRQCPYSAFAPMPFRSHLITQHSVEDLPESLKEYLVPAPFKTIADKDLLRKVLAKKHRIYKCKECGFTARRKDALAQHIARKHREKQHKCTQCGFMAATQYDLKIHKVHKHSSVAAFKCQHCDFSTNQKQALENHSARKHLAVKPFQCSKCELAFGVQVDLVKHFQRKHVAELQLKCSECEFTTHDSVSLNRHYKNMHIKKKPFKCELCDYAGALKKDLQVHIKRNHDESKRIFCQYCEYSTCNKQVMHSHCRRRHDREKSFRCDVCSYTGATKDDVARHVTRNHAGEKPTFECPKCDFVSRCEKYFNVHFFEKHSRDKPFICSACNFSSSLGEELKKHVEEVHPGAGVQPGNPGSSMVHPGSRVLPSSRVQQISSVQPGSLVQPSSSVQPGPSGHPSLPAPPGSVLLPPTGPPGPLSPPPVYVSTQLGEGGAGGMAGACPGEVEGVFPDGGCWGSSGGCLGELPKSAARRRPRKCGGSGGAKEEGAEVPGCRRRMGTRKAAVALVESEG